MQAMKVTVKDNQTILDFALEHFGTAEAIPEIIALNPLVANDPKALIAAGIEPGDFYMDVKLLPGMVLTIDENSTVIRKNAVKQIKIGVTTWQGQ